MAIAGAETFSGKRVSGFSPTDAMSWGVVVFRTGRGSAGNGLAVAVGALAANDRAGVEATEGETARGVADRGMAIRGTAAKAGVGAEICGGAEA
jgi:hypothetical protein